MNFFEKINLIWQKIGLVQRALLAAVVLASVLVGALLVHWARRPDMRMLYQGLPADDASKICEKISEQGITYELREGGTSVYVPKEKVYQLRLDMAREGLPVGGQTGYKIFDEEKIGISPFVQNVNLSRALQDELAKSIQMIEGVVHARVHIVSPDQGIFGSEAGQTTTSVVLRIRPGHRLIASNIAAITHMVAGSVKGLKSENVTVIDSQGRLLSSSSDQTLAAGASTVHDYKERVEQSLAKKVEDMLTTVLGPGRAVVRVSAVIDMNSISTVTETYNPSGKVITKEEVTSNSETPPSSPTGGQAGGTKKEEVAKTEYEVGKTIKQETILPGEIESLSVAAFVDLSPPDANEAGAGGSTATTMDITKVEEIIRSALGLKQADSGAVTVVDTKFPRPAELLVEEEPSSWPRYMAIVRHASLGIMAICALIVLKIFRGAKKKAGAEPGPEQLPAPGGAAGLLPAGRTGPEGLALRRQISEALQSNPERVRQLFSSWIAEKE